MKTRYFAAVSAIFVPLIGLTLLLPFPNGAGFGIVHAASAVSMLTSAPTVTSVSPASAPNDLDTPIVITGTGFAVESSVSIGNVKLAKVGWIDTTILTATVPWGLNPGVYTLTVTNPGGQSGSLQHAFTVGQGMGVWTSGGPYGGDIWHVFVNPLTPSQIFATSWWSGLFASEDKATQWRTAYLGAFPQRPAVDAQNSSVIYLSDNGGITRSDDGAMTWQPLPTPLNCPRTAHPFTHPTISGKVYLAVAGNPGVADDCGGLYKSTNRGATWTTITNGLTDTLVTALVFDPDNPDIMIAGTRSGNVFTSGDRGDTWSFAAHVADHIEQLAINPFGAHEVWAVYSGNYPYANGAPPYVFKSTNAGFTAWEPVTITTQGMVWSVTFHPTISGTIYAGSDAGYVSTDGGEDWQPLGSGLPIGGGTDGFEAGVKEISIDPQQTNRLYAATQQGVYQSPNSGTTWSKSDDKLGGVVPMDLAVSPFDPQTVYATTLGAGVIRTNNGGQTWQQINIPWSGMGSNLATDPFTDARLYAGGGYDANLYVSADGGLTYHTITLQLPITYTGYMITAQPIGPDPHHAGHILTGATFALGPDHSSWRGTFYSSDDYGEHWQWIDAGHVISQVTSIAYDPIHPNAVYAGTDGGELLKSGDGGATWQTLSGWHGSQTISAIAIHPQNSQEIFINGGDVGHRIWTSTDGGLTWNYLTNQPTTGPVEALSFAQTEPPTLYAATMNDGLWRSADGGQTWTAANGLSQGDVHSLATTTDGERVIVYVGISGGALNNSATSSPTRARASTGTTLLGSGVFRLSTLLSKHIYLPLLAK